MSDLLDLDDDDLLSVKESAPTAPTPPAVSASGIVQECPDCGARASKLGVPFITKAQVNTHRANVHGYSAPKSPPKKAATPKKPAAPKAASAKPSTPATARGVRKPLGEQISSIVLQLGRIINKVEPPTGAVIMFEAGALGDAIDKAVAGTFLDKPLQSAAQVSDKFAPLIPLATLPAMVFMCSRNPGMAEMLEGEMREAIEDVLVQSLPLLKKRAQRTQRTIDALAELKGLDDELASSDDPVGVILESFFVRPPEPGDGEN